MDDTLGNIERIEERWLSIPFEFRILILLSIVLCLILCLLYLYFFKEEFCKQVFCFKRFKKLFFKDSKTEETEDGYAKKLVHRSIHKSDKKRPYMKKPPHFVRPVFSSVNGTKSEINSQISQDFNQQVNRTKDTLIESINRYKNELSTNIKLINKSTIKKDRNEDTDALRVYNIVKLDAGAQPKVKEISTVRLPEKLEWPAKQNFYVESIASGFSEHLQITEVNTDDLKKPENVPILDDKK